MSQNYNNPDDLSQFVAESRLRGEAAPEGQAVAWCNLTPSGQIAHFDGKPMVMVGPVGNEHHKSPLYARPQPAAPAPVAGEAVAALPEKWRKQAHLVLAHELEAALAQDRASQAGDLPPPGQPFVGCQCPTCGEEFAASAAQPPAVGGDVSRGFDAWWRTHKKGTQKQDAKAAWIAALRTGGGGD